MKISNHLTNLRRWFDTNSELKQILLTFEPTPSVSATEIEEVQIIKKITLNRYCMVSVKLKIFFRENSPFPFIILSNHYG